jgi:hypothetical protein
MFKRASAVAAALAALVVLTATPASASPIFNTPGAGTSGCGVESGSITVLDPSGPILTVDGVRVDVSDCLDDYAVVCLDLVCLTTWEVNCPVLLKLCP